jgi:hypothetical protein
MKRAILALTFVFAVTSLSAQTKKKPEPKTQPIPTEQLGSQTQQPQIFNFRFDAGVLNIIVTALQSSSELDAKTSNQVINFLVKQANDSTLNKPIPKPKDN